MRSNIKSKLEDLKNRALLRKNNPDLNHFTTEVQKQLMSENAKDMYQAQMDTLDGSERVTDEHQNL